MQNPSAGKADFARNSLRTLCRDFRQRSRYCTLLKKVLKSGSMMDTADSDIIANFVARQKNGMQIPNGRNCGFSRFLMATPPSPLLIFASPHAMMKAEKARIRCARYGGFGVLDEINMAKNEALAVLHATLDFRRSIDVPGYDRLDVDPAARFIGTMNYGYAGTRELNEALTSRFAVIQVPAIDGDNLERLLTEEFPTLEKKYREQFVQLFLDLQKKCENAEISSRALDLRGMLDALRLIQKGLSAGTALDMGITNKAFDSYEQGLIRDIIAARIPAKLDRARLFTD